jgi:hypothetical protein
MAGGRKQGSIPDSIGTTPEGNNPGGSQTTESSVPQLLPAETPPDTMGEVGEGITAQGKKKEDLRRDRSQESQEGPTRIRANMSTKNSGGA